jgi:hypothetical protein
MHHFVNVILFSQPLLLLIEKQFMKGEKQNKYNNQYLVVAIKIFPYKNIYKSKKIPVQGFFFDNK